MAAGGAFAFFGAAKSAGLPLATASLLEGLLVRFITQVARILTGGAEKQGHTKHSFHYRGQAVDISMRNPVGTNDVFRCGEHCGFGAGGAEPRKNHWHLQLSPGNGSQPLPNVAGADPDV